MNKNKLDYSMTNFDIDKFGFGGRHIVRYRDLLKCDDINDLFGEDDFVIIFS